MIASVNPFATSRSFTTRSSKDTRAAKSVSRQFVRNYRTTGHNEDYVTWRRAARLAVKSLNAARSQHFMDRVHEASSWPREFKKN